MSTNLDWVGNSSAMGELKKFVMSPKGPILISGPYGVGKYSRLIEILKQNLTDDSIVETESSADSVRESCSECLFEPQDKYRALVIRDAHLLSDIAQDSLLSILESPPNRTIPFVICDDHTLLREALVSRFAYHNKWTSISNQELESFTKNQFVIDASFGSASVCMSLNGDPRYEELYEIAKSDDWAKRALITPIPEVLAKLGKDVCDRICASNSIRLASRSSPYSSILLKLASSIVSVPSLNSGLHWLSAAAKASML